MENWITTIGGILAAFGTVASQAPIPPPFNWIPTVIAAGGAAMVGLGAKDFNTHSTVNEVKQSTVDAGQTVPSSLGPPPEKQ